MDDAAWTIFGPDQLPTECVGREIRFFASVGSTNDLLKEAARQGVAEGLVFVADEQTAGRGRRGRSWLAPPGSSLLSSTLLRPTWLPPADAFLITMLIAVAVAEAIETTSGLPVGLKWPNDIQIAGRKLGGILVESELGDGQLNWVIAGCGLNVNWQPQAVPELTGFATSLSYELGRTLDRRELLRAVLLRLDARYRDLRLGARSALTADWRSRLTTLGQRVQVERSQSDLLGVAEDVTLDGALVVRDAHGTQHIITAGDVTVRPSDDATGTA